MHAHGLYTLFICAQSSRYVYVLYSMHAMCDTRTLIISAKIGVVGVIGVGVGVRRFRARYKVILSKVISRTDDNSSQSKSQKPQSKFSKGPVYNFWRRLTGLGTGLRPLEGLSYQQTIQKYITFRYRYSE